ncbi:MAG: peptide chain release factor 2 [Ardenticatenia bacterium]|nr:peptide chain release factor 2 [Ardenticatenia bacterium]
MEELEKESVSPGFWGDQVRAQAHMRRLSALQGEVDSWRGVSSRVTDALDMVELASLEQDETIIGDLDVEVKAIVSALEKMEFQVRMSGKHDRSDALLSIHAGAGGTESQDWTEMLLRMYLRWAEARKYGTEIVDSMPGDEAGLKSVTVLVEGPWAYGYIKTERGVHRLVRLSPFDSAHRRHTSFALVEVVPDIDDSIEIVMRPDDVRVDVFKSSGAGGQHVQKNSTAIRLTHKSTGIVVTCQNERSQAQNREMAMRILRGRLYDLERQKQEEEQARLKGEHIDAGWGNQIRSYVLHPYKMVKDHRTSHEVGNADAVLDGRLDDFIEVYLRQTAGQPAGETT